MLGSSKVIVEETEYLASLICSMTTLYERTFTISNFYASGIAFPFERLEFDSGICFRKKNAEHCTACIAVESEDPLSDKHSEETIIDIATIYSLATGHSFRLHSGGAHGLKSLEELGRGPRGSIHLTAEPLYSKEQLERHSARLVAGWEKTRDVWIKVKQVLDDRQFLRRSLFYYYRSHLVPMESYERDLDAAFVDAVIGLEALFNDGPQDIGYKLAVRAALLLSCFGKQDNKEVFNSIRELYGKRIKLVHGIEREVVTWSEYHLIREYLRDCLRSCLALSFDNDKKAILSFIDEALVKPSTREKLTITVKEGVTRLGW
jgi:hypothetical protein